MSGLPFDALAADVVPAVEAAHRTTLDRPDRRRAIGAGGAFGLSTADRILLAVVWLRRYPTQEVLGFLFGVSDSTALRAVRRCLPAVLADTPGYSVVIDTFEPRTHRSTRRPRAYYSGKKKAHTLTFQVAVDEETGGIVGVSDAVPGPWADMTVLKKFRLLTRLPKGVGGIGDLAYVGIADLHPDGSGAVLRKKPRGKDRPPEDRKYNRAFRRRRNIVEHAIGRLRRFRSVSHVNRHRRKGHAARVGRWPGWSTGSSRRRPSEPRMALRGGNGPQLP